MPRPLLVSSSVDGVSHICGVCAWGFLYKLQIIDVIVYLLLIHFETTEEAPYLEGALAVSLQACKLILPPCLLHLYRQISKPVIWLIHYNTCIVILHCPKRRVERVKKWYTIFPLNHLPAKLSTKSDVISNMLIFVDNNNNNRMIWFNISSLLHGLTLLMSLCCGLGLPLCYRQTLTNIYWPGGL